MCGAYRSGVARHRRAALSTTAATRAVLLALLLLCAMSGTAAAQAVRVTLSDSAAGRAIGGAIVELLRTDGGVAARGLSHANGQRLLTVGENGTYRVRVLRVGQSPFLSPPVVLHAESTVELSLALPIRPVTLPVSTIIGSTGCPRITEAGQAAAIWTEARTALTASELTRAEELVQLRLTTVQRTLDRSGRTRAVDTLASLLSTGRPFDSESAARLSRDGWVVETSARSWDFFAPDERVLLSDEFARDHCFGIARNPVAHPAAIGLSFEPTVDRTVADVRGTLWIDSATAELRELEFRFVRSGIPGAPPDIGGLVRFARLPSGAWIIADWRLRMPLLRGSTGRGGGIQLTGYRELAGSAVPVSTDRVGQELHADTSPSLPRAALQRAPAPAEIVTVRSAAPGAWGPGAKHLVPEIRYDSGNVGPTLQRVGSVAVGLDGDVYLYDETVGAVLAYDSTGRYRHAVGREGAGDGEYDRVHGLGTLPGDRLAVWDFGNQEVDLFTASGAWESSWPLASRLSTGGLFVGAAGHLLVQALLSPAERTPWTLGLVRLDPATGVRDTLVSPVQSGLEGVSTFFEPVGLWTWHPDGYFVGGRNDRYSFTLFRSDTGIRVEHASEPVGVGAAERAELEAQLRAAGRQRRPIPTVKPAYASIGVASDGRLWLRRHMPAKRLTDPELEHLGLPETRRWREPQRYDVFEADGRYLGVVAVPDDVRVVAVGREQLWGVTRAGGEGVALVRYRVER